ncbi:hypothetical protein BRC81_07050 [Halobacteriales archaeon QS_1_68_20]|nr:MAG: hypothetical protein BRC81_07050 [Halobacteriales archaeon QS_1_68_20]
MLDLDYRVHEVGDVTLVDAVVESSAPTPRRVRIESTLEGPVWPPRRDGLPERGWNGDAFEGVVPADGRLALGFASPAEPTEPPVFVVDQERADPDDARATLPAHARVGANDSLEDADDILEHGDGIPGEWTGISGDGIGVDRDAIDVHAVHDRTPTGVVRALGSPAPPPDAVPTPEGPGVQTTPEPAADQTAPETPADQPTPKTPAEQTTSEPRPAEEPSVGPVESAAPGVEAWLSAVERRVRRAEALAEARRVTVAAGALERAGGLDGARRLTDAVERDERALRAVADRARRLADRAAAADVPLSTLARLA